MTMESKVLFEKVKNPWELTSLGIAAAAVSMPSYDHEGNQYLPESNLGNISQALTDANREIKQLRTALHGVMSCGVCHGSGVRASMLNGRDYRTGVWSYIPCGCRENARRVLGEVKE